MPEPMEKGISSPEFAPRPERGREKNQAPENPSAGFGSLEVLSEAVTAAPVPVADAPSLVPVPEDPVAVSIETILSEDIFEHYQALPPDVQLKFRKKGEEAVSRLTIMVESTAIKAKEVLLIIVGWLKMIPGVSKYFLEQESKIKTDKIIELHKRQHGEK